jgi:hypothetical protein
MSLAYQTDATSLASDLNSVAAQWAAKGMYCSGNMFVDAANVKVSHVQIFVNNALAYVQTTKNTGSPIDKPTIINLFNSYRAQDLSWLSAVSFFGCGPPFNPANMIILYPACATSVNSSYDTAIAQINTM